MNEIESAVTAHYGRSGLLDRLLLGLRNAGIDTDNLCPADLQSIEEFHIGGRKATEYLVSKLGLQPTDAVLDIGSGIGGTARYIATAFGNHVTGIDLTPAYVVIATELSKRVSLNHKVYFETASALAMPFDDAVFDVAVTLHVAMNIRERVSFYAEIARVIKPGGRLGLFDVMKKNDEDLTFPTPWAQSPETSHLTTAPETAELLTNAGFTVTEVEDRTNHALEFFAQNSSNQFSEPPPLGVHLLMGDTAPVKFANVLSNIKSGRIGPVQIIARRHFF